MSMIPRISKAEWEVMEAVWRRHPATALEIVQDLSCSCDWKEQTIRTMLSRLVRKGALHYETEGRRFLYRPLWEREEMVKNESRTFLQRVMRGVAAPVLVQLVEEAQLTRDDIEELRTLLNKKQPQNPKKQT
ncbi:MAG: BlaI/MecI/CopY family transcriptional regulator [Blastochloris sp.]|nr:BlaI/MecI/CopY family transcriptional regulator [Blastochloris sp.]